MVALGAAALALWAGIMALIALGEGRPLDSPLAVVMMTLPLLGYLAVYPIVWLLTGAGWVWRSVSPWWTPRHSKLLGVGVLVAYVVLAVVEPRAARSVAATIGRGIYGIVLYVLPWAVIFGIYEMHLAWQRYQFKQQVELERRVAEEVERQLQLRAVAGGGSTAEPSREQSTTP